jgi:hypothetical protein
MNNRHNSNDDGHVNLLTAGGPSFDGGCVVRMVAGLPQFNGRCGLDVRFTPSNRSLGARWDFVAAHESTRSMFNRGYIRPFALSEAVIANSRGLFVRESGEDIMHQTHLASRSIAFSIPLIVMPGKNELKIETKWLLNG